MNASVVLISKIPEISNKQQEPFFCLSLGNARHQKAMCMSLSNQVMLGDQTLVLFTDLNQICHFPCSYAMGTNIETWPEF